MSGDVDDIETRELRRYFRGFNEPIERAIQMILELRKEKDSLRADIRWESDRREAMSSCGKDTCG